MPEASGSAQPARQSLPEQFTRAAGLGTGPVSVEAYRSPDLHDKEMDRVFWRAWLLIGREEDIPRAGDYFVFDFEGLRTSALVVRQADGGIKAFHNVCPHRGGRIVTNERGHAAKFVCGYHSWTFAKDGKLAGVPDLASFFDLDKDACGLVELHISCWNGWIFVNFSREPAPPLGQFLGSIAGRFEGLPWPNAQHAIELVADLNCNWKVAADAFAETYHVPVLHKQTIGGQLASSENPFSHVVNARVLGCHSTASFYGNPDYRPHEERLVEDLSLRLSGIRSIIECGEGDLQAFLAHPEVNATGSNSWSMDINFLFPNTHLNMGGQGSGFSSFGR